MKKEITRRNTRQRQVILDELCKVKTHPGADSIFKMVRKKIPNVSYGTVYRNLNLLRDEGKVLELSLGKYSCRYDGTVVSHSHFFCLRCKNIFDIAELNMNNLDGRISDRHNFKVEYHRIEFFGYCDKCKSHKN